MDKIHPFGKHCFKPSAIYFNKVEPNRTFPDILNTRNLVVEGHTNQNPFLCSFGGTRRAPPHFCTERNVFRKGMN